MHIRSVSPVNKVLGLLPQVSVKSALHFVNAVSFLSLIPVSGAILFIILQIQDSASFFLLRKNPVLRGTLELKTKFVRKVVLNSRESRQISYFSTRIKKL
jgi:hypothetical protein